MQSENAPEQPQRRWKLLLALIMIIVASCIMLRLVIMIMIYNNVSTSEQASVAFATATPIAGSTPTGVARSGPVTQPVRPSRSGKPSDRTGWDLITETAAAATATAAAMTVIPAHDSLVVEPAVIADKAPTPVGSRPTTSRQNPDALGTEIRLDDWAVVITDVQRGEAAVQLVAETNPFNPPPEAGYTYLIATLQLTNVSTDPEARSAAFALNLRVTGQRNILYSRARVVPPTPLERDLFPGGTQVGQIVFSIPVDETNLMFCVQEIAVFHQCAAFVAIDPGATLVPDQGLAAIEPNQAGSQRTAPAPMGELVITNDWELVVTDVVRGAAALELVQAANTFNTSPDAGMEYVAVKLRARLINSQRPDEVRSIDQLFLNITGEQNVVYERPLVVAPMPIFEAHLFPGGSIEGWEVFQVANGEQQLMLVFEPPLALFARDTRFLSLE